MSKFNELYNEQITKPIEEAIKSVFILMDGEEIYAVFDSKKAVTEFLSSLDPAETDEGDSVFEIKVNSSGLNTDLKPPVEWSWIKGKLK